MNPTAAVVWQNIGQAVVATAFIVVGGFSAFRQWHARRASSRPRVPSNGLANDHPDPTVARLERDLVRMDARLTSQAEQLDAADKRTIANRDRIDNLERERVRDHDRIDMLRRIVRRLLDSWPDSSPRPEITAEEWREIGIDEDTITPK